MASDTCDRCAAVWRAAIERAAEWAAQQSPCSYPEGPHTETEDIEDRMVGHIVLGIRALADTPAPCDCAARDRVVEAAVEQEHAIREAVRFGTAKSHRRCDKAAVDLKRAVAALEGAEHE